ncbi:MAG: ribosome biogenesis GTPase YlqF [Bacillota bacterium]
MVNWYPSHMAQAQKNLAEKLKIVDVVVELLDARIPKSSRNPKLQELISDQKRVIVLNKMDLADQSETDRWLTKLRQEAPAVAINSLTGERINSLVQTVKDLMADKLAQFKAQGRNERAIRLMIVGVPNVGKSQLIKQLAQGGKVRVGNQPGITRGQQWIKVRDDLNLLDTPGVLWPKIDDDQAGFKLAATGAVRENSYDAEVVGYKLLKILKRQAPSALKGRFKLEQISSDTLELMEDIGRKRGCLMSGGKIDRERVGNIILNEYQSGKLGAITLELSTPDIEV